MDGWSQLLEYDDTYQKISRQNDAGQSDYGFHESWDDLRDQISP